MTLHNVYFISINFFLIVLVTADLPKDDSSNDILLSATKLYIVIGCIVALVLVAIIQAGCTIYRTAKSPSPHHKVSFKLVLLFIETQRVLFRGVPIFSMA